jgi:hypothetical protein
METKERLYHGLLTITIGYTVDSGRHLLDDDCWSILPRFQRVHLTLHADNTKEAMSSARRTVGLLRQSKALRQFSFILESWWKGAEFERKKYALRRTTTSDGFKAGKNAVAMELDYASKAIELIEMELKWASMR